MGCLVNLHSLILFECSLKLPNSPYRNLEAGILIRGQFKFNTKFKKRVYFFLILCVLRRYYT